MSDEQKITDDMFKSGMDELLYKILTEGEPVTLKDGSVQFHPKTGEIVMRPPLAAYCGHIIKWILARTTMTGGDSQDPVERALLVEQKLRKMKLEEGGPLGKLPPLSDDDDPASHP